MTVICVFSPGRIGFFEKSGTVQPQVVTTSRITRGLSPRLTPVNVWLTRPSVSRIVPKSHVSGRKDRCSCAEAVKAHSVKRIRKITRFGIISL